MNEEVQTLVRYRPERAFETIEEARLLLAGGHANTYVNRLYNACFYAVSALLLLHDKSFAKHSGIRSAFHREFVRSGMVSKELGHLYDRLLAQVVHFEVESTVRVARIPRRVEPEVRANHLSA